MGEPNGKIQLFNDPQVNSIVIPIYKNGGKSFLNLVTVLTLHIDPQNLKITKTSMEKELAQKPPKNTIFLNQIYDTMTMTI